MKLYSWVRGPNPRRARIYLAEKGIDIEVVEAGDPSSPKLADWYLEKFPHRRVPLLELDDGDWIAEAGVICRYLDRLYPENPLFGRDAKEEAIIDMWERYAELEGLIPVAEYFRNTHEAFVGRGLAGYDREIPQIPELAERGRVCVGLFLNKIDRQLSDNEFLAGDTFSMADVTAFCATEAGIRNSLANPKDWQNVARWHAAISVRPSAEA